MLRVFVKSLLFIMVMVVLTVDSKGWYRNRNMETLYADDLVLCGESVNEMMSKYDKWKRTYGAQDGNDAIAANLYPSGVCGKRLRYNSGQCLQCLVWDHRRCLDIL